MAETAIFLAIFVFRYFIFCCSRYSVPVCKCAWRNYSLFCLVLSDQSCTLFSLMIASLCILYDLSGLFLLALLSCVSISIISSLECFFFLSFSIFFIYIIPIVLLTFISSLTSLPTVESSRSRCLKYAAWIEPKFISTCYSFIFYLYAYPPLLEELSPPNEAALCSGWVKPSNLYWRCYSIYFHIYWGYCSSQKGTIFDCIFS